MCHLYEGDTQDCLLDICREPNNRRAVDGECVKNIQFR